MRSGLSAWLTLRSRFLVVGSDGRAPTRRPVASPAGRGDISQDRVDTRLRCGRYRAFVPDQPAVIVDAVNGPRSAACPAADRSNRRSPTRATRRRFPAPAAAHSRRWPPVALLPARQAAALRWRTRCRVPVRRRPNRSVPSLKRATATELPAGSPPPSMRVTVPSSFSSRSTCSLTTLIGSDYVDGGPVKALELGGRRPRHPVALHEQDRCPALGGQSGCRHRHRRWRVQGGHDQRLRVAFAQRAGELLDRHGQRRRVSLVRSARTVIPGGRRRVAEQRSPGRPRRCSRLWAASPPGRLRWQSAARARWCRAVARAVACRQAWRRQRRRPVAFVHQHHRLGRVAAVNPGYTASATAAASPAASEPPRRVVFLVAQRRGAVFSGRSQGRPGAAGR